MRCEIVTCLFLGMTSCLAMDNPADEPINCQVEDQTADLKDYQKFAQEIYETFTGKDRELLLKLSEIVLQKENNKRYELAAQCLKEIWEYRDQSEDGLNLLILSMHLLDTDNTFNLYFDENNPFVKDILDKMNAETRDGPTESESDGDN